MDLSEAQLRSKSNFHNIFEESSVAIAVFYGKDFLVESANKKKLLLWNRSLKEVINKPLFEILPEVKSQEMIHILQNVFNTGISYLHKKMPVQLFRNNITETAYFDINYDPYYNNEGQVDGIVVTSCEVTEYVEINKKNRLEKLVFERIGILQQSNEQLRQFTFIASHDLKEPLRKIKMLSSRLSFEHETVLPANAKRLLEKIDKTVSSTDEMINAILNYATADNTEVSVDMLDINNIIKTIETELELLILEKDARIFYDNLLPVEGIDILIARMFHNLILNALKYSKQGEAVNIIIDSAVFIRGGKEYVQYCVADNGIGFEPAFAEKIMEPFARLHSKNEFDGTGLGLSFCRQVSERHGGSIAADGQPGKGAKFTIILPSKYSLY